MCQRGLFREGLLSRPELQAWRQDPAGKYNSKREQVIMGHPNSQESLNLQLRKDGQAYTTHFELGDRVKAGALVPQLGAIQHGDHLCSFYHSPSEQLGVVVPFLKEGLTRGEACLYVAVDRTVNEVTGALEAVAIDVKRELHRGALSFVDKWQWRNPGNFDINAMAKGVQELVRHALSPGFPGLWISVDMTWALDPDISPEELARWESGLNDLIREAPVVLLCQYNCGQVAPETLLYELQTHPMVILGDHVHPNFFYESPDVFLGKITPVGKVNWMINQLHMAAAKEEALRASEERFRLLVEGVKDYAIFMLDPEGRIQSWNSGAERIKGYRSEEVIGKHFSIFYPNEDVRAGKPELGLKVAASQGEWEDEGWRIRKDGSHFWASVIITALRDQKGDLRGYAKITRDITERKRYEDSLRQLSGQLLRLQDEERRRLARELHDSTAQTLSALSINLAVLNEYLKDAREPRISKVLSGSITLANQAGREIRNFSYLLHPPLLDESGLADALRWYVNGFVQRTNFSVDLQVASNLGRLSHDQERALFRVVQESLTNVHRHSGSSTAEIRLFQDCSNIVLEIRDHGKGLPSRTDGQDSCTPATLGVGIRGMRERLRQLGGSLEIGSANPGTFVRAVLPLTEAYSFKISVGRLPEVSAGQSL
jgi:PAS domain S-box-containing protein